jgi:hypothetical protein
MKKNPLLDRLVEIMEMGHKVTFDGKDKIIYVEGKMHWHVEDFSNAQPFTNSGIDSGTINQVIHSDWWEENSET